VSSEKKPTTRARLGLGGLTINAMALIAPGAFLWLTFFEQSSYGAPMAAQGMWFGAVWSCREHSLYAFLLDRSVHGRRDELA